MKKFKLIVPSFVALIFCMLLIAGSTFALFTSQASASVAVTSGKVQVSANFDENSLKVYSAKAVESFGENDDVAGTISSGDFAGKYIFDLQTRTATAETKTYHLFANNADNTETGALLESGKITLTNMTPGDKVKATLKLENNSNVNIKYRVKVNLVSGLKLFEGLQIKLDGVLLQGVAKTGTWTFLAAPTSTDDNMCDLNIEILLPLESGNKYQDLTTVLNFTLEAVQANAKTTDETLNTNIALQQVVEDHTEDQIVKDDAQLVEVTVPAAALPATASQANTTTSLEVKVEPQTTVSDLTLTSVQTAQSYDLEVLIKTQVGEAAPTTEKYNEANDLNATGLKIKMFVGKDLKGVELYHKGDSLTKVNSLAAVDQVGEFYYDSETGYITLMTNSFSEYTVVYNKDLVVETVNEQTQESTFTTYEATETSGVYSKEVVNEQTGEKTVELTTVEVYEETGEIKIIETGAELSEENLSVLDQATNVVFGDGYMLATLSDGVVYCFEDGTVKVYNATNFNGWNGESYDNETFYAGKLIEIDGWYNAFNGCTTIKKIVVVSDISYAYKGLDGNETIKTIEFANGTTYVPERLTFGSAVRNVELSNTITEIAHHAFYNSPELLHVTTPASVQKIGEQAFCYCASILYVIIEGNPEIDQYYLGRDCASLSRVIFTGDDVKFTREGTSMIFTNNQNNNYNDIRISFASETVKERYEAKCGTHPGVELVVEQGPYVLPPDPMEEVEGEW